MQRGQSRDQPFDPLAAPAQQLPSYLALVFPEDAPRACFRLNQPGDIAARTQFRDKPAQLCIETKVIELVERKAGEAKARRKN